MTIAYGATYTNGTTSFRTFTDASITSSTATSATISVTSGIQIKDPKGVTGSCSEVRYQAAYKTVGSTTTTLFTRSKVNLYVAVQASSSWTTIGEYSKTSTVTVTKTHAAQTLKFTSETMIVTAKYGLVPTEAYSGSGTVTVTVPAKTSYTVSYNANGGSGAPSAQTKWHGESLTLSSTKPTRSNATATYTVTYNHNYTGSSNATASTTKTTKYTFSKWNTASGGSGDNYNAGASYTANAAATLYAQWTSSTTTPAITLRTPTRTGYTFGGWYKEAACTTKIGNAGASYTPTANVTMYAKWTINTYTVSYNANGGSGAPSSQTKTYGTALTLSSTKPTRTNYVFKNWNTKSDGTGTSYNPGVSYTSNAAVTLYAQWYAPYTITPNANGGTLASGCSALTKVYNTALTLWASSKNPTRTGYTFYKWNTKQDGTGTAYSAGASYTTNAAATLYAQWTVNKYTISFNANGGVSAPASVTKTYGQSVTLPTAKPTRIGHTFLGWAETSSATTAKWAAGATFSDVITANKTLYAVWRDDYTAPQITSLKAFRCDSQGREDDEGSYAIVQAVWSIDTSVDEGVTNSGAVTGTIAAEGESPETFQFSSGASGTSGTAYVKLPNLDTDTQYIVRVTVTDIKGAVKATTRTVLILRTFYIMDFGNEGQSVGIGRAASNLGLEVGYKTIFDDTVDILGHTAYFRSSNFAHDTTPSTIQQGDARVQFQDDGGNRVGEIWPLKWNNGDLGMRLEAKDPTQNVYNYLDVRVTDDGQKTYSVGSPANFRSAIGAVNKAGDTVTGIYIMKSTNIDRDGADPTSDTTGSSRIRLTDKDGESIGHIDSTRRADGRQDLRLIVYNENNGAEVSNYLQVSVAKDGTCSFSIGDQGAFRSAIGLNASTSANITLNSACVAYDTASTPKYMKYGNVVQVAGAVKPASEVAAGTTMTIGTLPSGYRPKLAITTICQGSSNCVWMLRITTGGVMTAERYRSGNTSAAMTTTTWLTFNAVFLV